MPNAALLIAHNQPLKLAQIASNPLLYGQVRVRILASGICGAQLQEIRGEKAANFPLPRLLGHEACGIVEEVGPGVTKVLPHDKVVAHWRVGEGLESASPVYEYEGKQIGAGRIATFSEEAVISENRITKVPQDTPRELCALLGCGLSTALGTIENEAAIKFGESVLIVGVGGLGANLIRAAKIRGAGFISACDIHDKANLALSLGAHTFTRPTKDLTRFNDGGPITEFNVIINTAGEEAMEDTLPLLASGGRYIMVGQPRPGAGVLMRNARHLFDGEGKTVKATQGGAFNPTRDIPRYVDLWRTGRLRLEGLITHRLPLAMINEGIDLVRNGLAGRVLIEMP